MVYLYYGKTDTGRVRGMNQDCFETAQLGDSTLFFIVCDGMGGARGGEVASSLACATALKAVKAKFSSAASKSSGKDKDKGKNKDKSSSITDILVGAVEAANKAVYKRAKSDPTLLGMGTTLVAALIMKDMLYAVNIGDSRLYLFTENEIKQITRDHSYVQYLVDLGLLTSEQAAVSSHKNIVTRVVGTDKNVVPDTFTISLSEGDKILLCSDGLSNYLDRTELRNTVLASGISTEEKVNELIRLANEKGGGDNITAVLIEL
ncbi:MAG: Stp1/IreP family PP2C-type Ser/Thr phosphatase [Eubacteriales bacterium]|jgi:serine/threonine protein phosphatase PrpC|nr:Stp1/IreP family PP2C-type Ser/Thr phosphatase [Clostridiales bacterium]